MSKYLNFTLFVFTMLFIAFSCASKKTKVETTVERKIKTIPSESEIVLHYVLDKKGIRDTFNRSIDLAIKESLSEMEDGIKLDIKRNTSVDVEFEGKSVLVKLPIDVTIIKQTFIKDFKAKGLLEMVFISNLDINENWNLSTNTIIAYYRWINAPKIDMSIVKIPIEGIVNRVINDYKPQIEKNIDLSMKNSFDLRARATQNMLALKEPMKITDPMEGWLQIVPLQAYYTGASNLAESTNGKIALVCNNRYSLSQPLINNEVKRKVLPPIAFRESLPDSSTLRINTSLDKNSLNAWVDQNFEGKTFKDGDKSITVKSVDIRTRPGWFEADVDVTGSFTGRLQLKGKPAYDSLRNIVYASDVDLSIKSKNILHSAFSWLFKGKIRKNLESMMVFPLQQNIADAQKTLNKQLQEIKKKYDLELKADIGSIILEDIDVTDDEILALIKLNVWLQMKVTDFRSFNKF